MNNRKIILDELLEEMQKLSDRLKILENKEVVDNINEHEDLNLLIEDTDVTLNTFSNKPIIKAKIGNDNIIYVDECNNPKNACSTTRIKIFDSYFWMNVCDMDGKTSINLDIALKEKNLYNIPFIVKEKVNNCETFLEIRKDILND